MAKGLTGFSQLGVRTSSDSSDTGTDSSVDSRLSKKKKKSISRRRKRLLRLNQYTSTQKKLKTFEECISACMGLACKLIEKGCPIKGFLEHVWFVAEQASLNRFRPEAILAYDQGVRDKATKHGLDVLGYGDADNFYWYLGAAALKKETKVKNVPPNRYQEGRGKSSEIKELRICGRYNHGHCQYGSSCFRKHVCFACQQPHP